MRCLYPKLHTGASRSYAAPPVDLHAFRYAVAIEASSEHLNRGGHIGNVEIAGLLHQARMGYLLEGVGLARTQLYDDERNMVLREVRITYEREVRGQAPLTATVRTIKRSRRSFTLEEAIWLTDTGELVASTNALLIIVSRSTGKGMEVPADVWDAVEAYEGRAIPV